MSVIILDTLASSPGIVATSKSTSHHDQKISLRMNKLSISNDIKMEMEGTSLEKVPPRIVLHKMPQMDIQHLSEKWTNPFHLLYLI